MAKRRAPDPFFLVNSLGLLPLSSSNEGSSICSSGSSSSESSSFSDPFSAGLYSLLPRGFLAIPKSMFLYLLMFYRPTYATLLATHEHADNADFWKFRHQLFHSSLEHILSSLRPHMTTPHVTQCGDGHLHCVIYGLGLYIADYPEQALLACIVHGWCPKCVAIVLNFRHSLVIISDAQIHQMILTNQIQHPVLTPIPTCL